MPQACVDGCAEARRRRPARSVEAANFNDPKQTVIAGTKAGVDKACEVLKAKGAKRALPLPVSAPFHSSLMKPAAERLQRAARRRRRCAAPQIPLVNNIDVAVETDAAAIRDALYRQAYGPVRWVEMRAGDPRARRHAICSNAARARCWPAWSSASTPSWSSGAVFDPATLAEAKGVAGMSDVHDLRARWRW